MEGCYYFSLWGQAFGWTQMVPLIATLILTVLTMATQEMTYVLFGFFLYIPQFVVWLFQWYFQVIRPDPICQTYHTWAFPSMEAMYVGAIVGALIGYAILWKANHGWVTWFALYVFGIVPPVILFYSGYNRWWEVLFSLGFGLLSGLLFALVFRYFIRPRMGYLRCHFPFSLFDYVDTLCGSSEREYREILASFF